MYVNVIPVLIFVYQYSNPREYIFDNRFHTFRILCNHILYVSQNHNLALDNMFRELFLVQTTCFLSTKLTSVNITEHQYQEKHSGVTIALFPNGQGVVTNVPHSLHSRFIVVLLHDIVLLFSLYIIKSFIDLPHLNVAVILNHHSIIQF